MNIFTNEHLVRRNARIAQITLLAGLVVLAGGMVVSFRNQEELAALSLVALVLGFILSQIGIYYSNRWGRSPRPDQLLNKELKGLDGKYSIYHYKTPASHVLVGPPGVWILLPKHQRGTISYSRGRYHQRGGGLLLNYLKIFAQEGLGRPDLEVSGEIDALRKLLEKRLPEDVGIPEIQAALVFTNPKVEIIQPEDGTLPAEMVQIGRLKDLIRKKAKGKGLSVEKARQIQEALE